MLLLNISTQYCWIMQNGELAIYYEIESGESVEQRGIIETEHSTSRSILLQSFLYKLHIRYV